eukprot:TRINITY_DN1709_c0_g1_i1.p1 TRINITY_DN1709_c0_g1~~TRINITY_DN1709_c0_g1_i1.p1  ORF type:complete len:502 (-),score=156.51 TRINITY_DN1709_c0_g1_i1:26-1531(-)
MTELSSQVLSDPSFLMDTSWLLDNDFLSSVSFNEDVSFWNTNQIIPDPNPNNSMMTDASSASSDSSSSTSSPYTSPPTSPSSISPAAIFGVDNTNFTSMILNDEFADHIGSSTDSSPLTISDSSPPTHSKKTKSSAAAASSSKRPRKRSRKENMAPTAVTLPREQLLKLTSSELDTYAENIRTVRPLTSEEEKDIRRQRRLIKNRESASLSRQRRKNHLAELEANVNALTDENDVLKQEVKDLRSENSNLKEEVKKLRKIIEQEDETGNYDSENDGTKISTLSKIANAFAIQKKAPNTVKNAGVYLLVLLLSFGVFFNANMNPELSTVGPSILQTATVIGNPSNLAGHFDQQTKVDGNVALNLMGIEKAYVYSDNSRNPSSADGLPSGNNVWAQRGMNRDLLEVDEARGMKRSRAVFEEVEDDGWEQRKKMKEEKLLFEVLDQLGEAGKSKDFPIVIDLEDENTAFTAVAKNATDAHPVTQVDLISPPGPGFLRNQNATHV